MEQLNVNNKIMNIVIFSRKEYFNTIFPTLIQISRDSLLSLSTYRKRPVKSSITVKKKISPTRYPPRGPAIRPAYPGLPLRGKGWQ